MFSNIAVIGIGQLGCRYLQGLLQAKSDLEIWAIDTIPDALERAREVLSQPSTSFPIRYSDSIRDIPQDIDLAISATTADARLSTLRQLLEGRHVRSLLLEKVLTQSLSESRQMMRLAGQVPHVWVNYPRRAMSWHRSLRKYVSGKTPVHGSVVGPLWGLMTNSLHFIDLFEWWTGSRAMEIQVRDHSLQWFESKRPGFLDATGIIDVTFSDGSTLILQSQPSGNQTRKVHIVVDGGGTTLNISEIDGIAWGSMLTKPIAGRLELQSQLTGPLVDQILESGTCRLPTLPDVLATHDLFISKLLSEQDRRYSSKGKLMVT